MLWNGSKHTGVSEGMSEINRVYGVNLSGIVPTSECLGDILYEETCSRSNINQNVPTWFFDLWQN